MRVTALPPAGVGLTWELGLTYNALRCAKRNGVCFSVAGRDYGLLTAGGPGQRREGGADCREARSGVLSACCRRGLEVAQEAPRPAVYAV